jgi:hypothetical protein
MASVAGEMVGFCNVLVKKEGPDQLYDVYASTLNAIVPFTQ